MWASFIKNHKNLTFLCRCIFFYIVAVNNIAKKKKYEFLWRSLHVLGKDVVSSNAEGTLMKRGGKIFPDVMDLGICTREKLAHVRDCKTGTQSSCDLFF